MSSLRVLVVGASVAGPTTAYWLAKAGASVTVIERFPELRTNGQQIDIRTAGVTVMQRTEGMEAAVRAKLAPMKGGRCIGTDGKQFAFLAATGNPEEQSIISEYEIFRGDLSRILYDMTKDNDRIRYVFDEQVTAIREQQGEGSVTVDFANHLPSTDFDLVVACDGATSRTRAIGLGAGVQDHMRPLGIWAAYFTMKKDIREGSMAGTMYCSPRGRFSAFGPTRDDRTSVGLISAHPDPEGKDMNAFRAANKEGDAALKKYVSDRYRDAGWRTGEILQGLMDSDDLYASESVQVKVPSLYKGRFVMVGDAGYAPGTTGTGTSLAMAGAYILAGEINEHPHELEAGLKGYADRMKPIIADMSSIPPGLKTMMAPQSAWGLEIRNMIIRIVAGASLLGKLFAWIGRFFVSGFARDKYGIPEYKFPH